MTRVLAVVSIFALASVAFAAEPEKPAAPPCCTFTMSQQQAIELYQIVDQSNAPHAVVKGLETLLEAQFTAQQPKKDEEKAVEKKPEEPVGPKQEAKPKK